MDKLNILLPTANLDIGGAETYVVGLAKELKKLGHAPVVVSSGGVYVKELENHGIAHYIAPLNSRKAGDLLQCIRIFRQAIHQEKIDLIHTHGRIPSLVAQWISLRDKIPFMATAHALFNERGGLKYLTFWGSEIIAVSEDVKRHLIHRFGQRSEQITVIENGIDTEAFRPAPPNPALIKELNLEADALKLVYVSRLTGSLAQTAVEVAKAVLLLKEEMGQVVLLLAGDGEDFELVRRAVAQADPKGETIRLLGKRLDIPDLLNLADGVIAVARTALEAMATEKPVILAGGEGYLGLLTPEKYEVARGTNFTGRNIHQPAGPRQLADEILDLFQGHTPEERRLLGDFGRRRVTEHFSLAQMTKKNVQVYEKLLKNGRPAHEAH